MEACGLSVELYINKRRKLDLPVAGDGLEATIVHAEWNVESDNGLAGLDKIEILLINASLGGSVVEMKLNLLEETWLTMGVKSWTSLLQVGGSK